MSTAFINNEILKWAIARKGINPDEIKSFHPKYQDWESGEVLPTFNQAKKLASKLKIPFAYLFLSVPPEEIQAVPDLRTLGDFHHSSFSADLLAVIEDATRKQDWYREQLRIAHVDPLPFIGKYNVRSGVQVVANDITEVLSLSIEQRRRHVELLRFITEQCENAGILVLRNGKVGANTHRKLDIEEFRGFTLSDPYAPLVFINSTDYIAAQVFTLVHEVAHIWIGQEGVSNVALNNDGESHNKTEQFCNRVAAEVLVPTERLKDMWKEQQGSLEQRCDALKRVFNVSTIVLARRALDLELTKRDEFFSYYQELVEIWRQKKQTQSGGGGGDFHKSFPVANSKTLTNAVCHAVYSGEMLLRDGARLLGVKPATLHNYAKQGAMI